MIHRKKIASATNDMKFREICEDAPGINNKKLDIKLVRLFIRYSTRLFGMRIGGALLALILSALPKNIKNKNYEYLIYLLKINMKRINSFYHLGLAELRNSVEDKIQWAEISFNESKSLKVRLLSKHYLALMSKYGFSNSNYSVKKSTEAQKIDRVFYIFGPNSQTDLSQKYANATLVLMKPISLNTEMFKNTYLYVNSIYYKRVLTQDEELKKSLLKKYQQIFVSCRQSILEAPFQRAKFPLCDSLAGPMALGRVLYDLKLRYGEFKCIIEGFDFYVQPSSYSSYYPTLINNKKSEINERAICLSLAEHDGLYNFLFVKEIMEGIELIDSEDFKKIIGMSGMEYLNELSKNRRFKTLRSL